MCVRRRAGLVGAGQLSCGCGRSGDGGADTDVGRDAHQSRHLRPHLVLSPGTQKCRYGARPCGGRSWTRDGHGVASRWRGGHRPGPGWMWNDTGNRPGGRPAEPIHGIDRLHRPLPVDRARRYGRPHGRRGPVAVPGIPPQRIPDQPEQLEPGAKLTAHEVHAGSALVIVVQIPSPGSGYVVSDASSC